MNEEELTEIEERAAIQTEHLEGIKADIEYRRLIKEAVKRWELRQKYGL